MQFSHIHLQNWRNFAEADVELQRRVFLVGPNASGKSNFLDAFRFLHDLASVGGGLPEAVNARRGGVTKLRSLAARRVTDVVVDVSIGDEKSGREWRYELQFNQDNRQRPQVKREVVRKDGKVLLERPVPADRQDPERLTRTYLEEVNVNRPFRDLAEFFGSIRYQHIVPQLVRDPDRYTVKQSDPFGSDFLEQVARTTARSRDARLRRIGEALRVAVPQLQELQFFRDPVKGTPHLRGRYEHWRQKGAWQSEEQFSDGTLRLLGLLWTVLDGSGPLLLEEPELSLHPEVVQHLPQFFARMQRRTRRQIIVSTHSPELLGGEGIALDEVLLLIPQREGTTLSVATSFAEIPELLAGGVPLAEAALARTRPQNAVQLPLFADR